jgi:hypothetical protein
MEELKSLLQQVLVANVLILARYVQEDKKGKGVSASTSDYTREAVELIRRKQPDILRLLR